MTERHIAAAKNRLTVVVDAIFVYLPEVRNIFRLNQLLFQRFLDAVLDEPAHYSRSASSIGPAMNFLSREKQIEVISALTEGLGIRATARITGVNRETVGKLALQVGRGAAELHDRMMVGIRVNRIECDELWAYVGHKRNPQKGPMRHPSPVKGDQYTYVALASSTRAIIGYLTGKRTTENTDQFIQDVRQRVIGVPEISTDGLACTRFRRHRVRCFNGTGGGSWRGGSLLESSSLRRCG
ncbi:MAG: hypothetical protein WBB34_21785 [Xanthobacteraceae bacterium]